MKPYIPILLLVLSCTLLAGCSNHSTPAPAKETVQEQPSVRALPSISPTSQEWTQKGLAAYQQFDYDAAIAAYDKAIELDKNNYNAFSGKGVALAMRGNAVSSKADAEEGIQLIKKALAIAPDDTASFYNLALACKINGQYDESIEWFQKVIDKDPQNTWSYYGIATIYGDRGDASHAVAYLKKAAAIDRDAVLEAARTQSHFDAIRTDAAFRELTAP